MVTSAAELLRRANRECCTLLLRARRVDGVGPSLAAVVAREGIAAVVIVRIVNGTIVVAVVVVAIALMCVGVVVFGVGAIEGSFLRVHRYLVIACGWIQEHVPSGMMLKIFH